MAGLGASSRRSCSRFDQSIMKFPSIKRFPGGASTDLTPNLQDPENPVPALKNFPPPPPIGGHGG